MKTFRALDLFSPTGWGPLRIPLKRYAIDRNRSHDSDDDPHKQQAERDAMKPKE